jgi:hypothetical protein
MSDLFNQLREQAEMEEKRLEEDVKAEGWSELMSERFTFMDKMATKDKCAPISRDSDPAGGEFVPLLVLGTATPPLLGDPGGKSTC